MGADPPVSAGDGSVCLRGLSKLPEAQDSLPLAPSSGILRSGQRSRVTPSTPALGLLAIGALSPPSHTALVSWELPLVSVQLLVLAAAVGGEDCPLAGRASAAGSRRRAVGSRPDPAQPPVTRVPGWPCGAGVPGAAGSPCPCAGPCLGTLTLRPLPGFCAGPGPGPPRPGRAGTGLLCSSGGPEGCLGNGTLLPFPPPHPPPPHPKTKGRQRGWACPWQPWRQDAPGLCGWPSCWLSFGATWGQVLRVGHPVPLAALAGPPHSLCPSGLGCCGCDRPLCERALLLLT